MSPRRSAGVSTAPEADPRRFAVAPPGDDADHYVAFSGVGEDFPATPLVRAPGAAAVAASGGGGCRLSIPFLFRRRAEPHAAPGSPPPLAVPGADAGDFPGSPFALLRHWLWRAATAAPPALAKRLRARRRLTALAACAAALVLVLFAGAAIVGVGRRRLALPPAAAPAASALASLARPTRVAESAGASAGPVDPTHERLFAHAAPYSAAFSGRNFGADFVEFMQRYDKAYDSLEEKTRRFDIFFKNLLLIEAHNARPNVSYTLGVNHFADLEPEEFRRKHLSGYRKRRPAASVDRVLAKRWRSASTGRPEDEGRVFWGGRGAENLLGAAGGRTASGVRIAPSPLRAVAGGGGAAAGDWDSSSTTSSTSDGSDDGSDDDDAPTDWSLDKADDASLPANVDWRVKGCVSEVKNQKKCGSCWAFSTTGSVEGAYCAKHGGAKVSLSEQQLVDCAGSPNAGCNGGMMNAAFAFIRQNGGLCAEADYPYQAAQSSCQQCSPVAKVTGFYNVPQGSEKALRAALALRGPISIAIEADTLSFQFYKGGVFDAKCGSNLDHGVLAVGYGKDSMSGEDYWIVKNSWGPSWGEHGFIRLVRTAYSKTGQCGILLDPSYPVVE